MPRPLHVVLLAGGEGKRMRSPVPKVLIELLGRPVLGHVLDAVQGLRPASRIIVGGRHLPAMRKAFAGEAGLRFVRQATPKGTAHAVRMALRALPKRGAEVLIMNGDGPLVRTESLRALVQQHRQAGADVSVVTAIVPNPAGLGRIVRGPDGRFLRIVEEKDATPEERALREINSGQYVVRAEALHRLIPRIGKANAQGEYYLTDLVEMAGRVAAFPLDDPEEARGINRPNELVEVRRVLKERILAGLMENGVVVVDPDLSYVESGVCVGEGTVLHPFVVLRRGVSIGPRCSVGPFAHLRAGAVLDEEVKIGNFVEVKATRLARGSRALHLSYLGDAALGAGVNVGAGTITANFDGRRKHKTEIGDRVSLGSGTVLIAPVTVNPDARTGAGAIVPAGCDVPAGATVVGVPARVLSRRPNTKKTGSARAQDRARRRR